MSSPAAELNVPGLCPICGSSARNGRKIPLLHCRRCGLKWEPFNPTLFSPSALYKKDYFKGKVYKDYRGEEEFRRRLFRDKIELIREQLPPKGKVLDLGCGMGFFLHEMRALGYEAAGVEISEYAAEIAAENREMEIYCGDVDSAEKLEGNRDIVSLWDVLEHLPNPGRTLKTVRRLISPEGTLVVETLNTASLAAAVLGKRWPLYTPPWHLFYFNRKCMRQLLHSAGFEIVQAYPIQTYLPVNGGFKAFRYFRNPFMQKSGLKKLAGMLFPDVVIYIAKPVEVRN